MTNEMFEAMKNRIKADKSSIKTPWYDGHKWTDGFGNWYGWESCGFVEYLFCVGKIWERRTDYKGDYKIKELCRNRSGKRA